MIPKGKHHPPPEPVVKPAVSLNRQSSSRQYPLIKLFLLKKQRKRVPTVRAVSQAECFDGFTRDAAVFKVRKRLFSQPVTSKHILVKLTAKSVDLIKFFFQFLLWRITYPFGQCYAGPSRQLFQSFKKINVLILHDKINDRPALPASEAMKCLAFRRHHK